MLRDGLAPGHQAEVAGTTLAEREAWWAETGRGQLRQLVYWRWDPIGVSGEFPTTHDEYNIYADAMRDPLVAETDDGELKAGVLRAVLGAQTSMGLERKPKAEEDRRRLTDLILDWRYQSIWLWKEYGR
jgi:hypothetical protein